MSREAEAALLATAVDSSEATVWEAILHGEDIPCFVRDYNVLTQLREPLPFGMSTIDVYVPTSELARARELLNLTADRHPPVPPPTLETQMILGVALCVAIGLAVGIAGLLGWR